MYKLKYEKYKQKYLALKYFLQMNLKGGKPLNNIFFFFLAKDDFIAYYREKISTLNAYEILITLFKDNLLDRDIGLEPLTILVGAANHIECDYDRFKDSKLYSLYIDTRDSTDPSRQYDMYTIGYKNIFSDIKRFPAESVNHIHFDHGVAYWCSTNYFELAEHILIKGGKIIFQLSQNRAYIYKHDYKDIFIIAGEKGMITKAELESRFKISINTETKMIAQKMDKIIYDRTFHQDDPTSLQNDFISPQNGVRIFDLKTNLEFSSDYTPYLEYCSKRYSRLQFELKKFTYLNYIFPIPFKIINPYNHIIANDDILSFIFNKVMSLDERNDYIINKKLSEEKIIEFVERVVSNNDLKQEFFEQFIKLRTQSDVEYLEADPKRTFNLIYNIVIKKFQREYIYMEGTKI
jgi:hypothetical protein